MADTKNTFHLGLCMAGSISAGAYTAGVIDYLLEALENWEKVRGEANVPKHQVVIDLLCGSSGGGITGAMTLFALMDRKMDHVKLDDDGLIYKKPVNNILWDSWVELSGGDVFEQLMGTDEIRKGEVRSLLNSNFIDKTAENLKAYIKALVSSGMGKPPFAGNAPEMFMTLFNITGIKYRLHSMAATSKSGGQQYVADHRDIAHFRWTEKPYENDGRIPLNKTLENLDTVIEGAKATGAFPIGLKARPVSRKAKYLWDNPFFRKGVNFERVDIILGANITDPEQVYTSINADGGTANNEPIELARDLLFNMRQKSYDNIPEKQAIDKMDDAQKAEAIKKYLTNTSVILIDPFPSTNHVIKPPTSKSDILFNYAPSMIGAMNKQLIFDAKDTLAAYRKLNYGLHIIAPSKNDVDPSIAIACGSLQGFGGFLDREFRVHDFFLGRKNCESFIRKYFVVNMNEADPESRECVDVILKSYKENPEAMKRFKFEDEQERQLVPIIPDVSLTAPIKFEPIGIKGEFETVVPHKLPEYKLEKLKPEFLDKYTSLVKGRYLALTKNLLGSVIGCLVGILAWFFRGTATRKVLEKIKKELKAGELIEE